ncbi:MAG TPA: hypothetical protein VFZ59_13975 [Verrucomicrobiae bacterium]|nr:hypothetical protein [Verrucomicrobiae bacterium]
MKNRTHSILACFSLTLLIGAVASAQTVRERLEKEPDFKIYSVIFGVTATTNSSAPAVRLAKVIDPKSGTTDAVKVDVPDAFIKAAKEKIEAKKYEPKLKDGKPAEFFTYFFYVPGHSNIVVVDLDKPLNKQP